MTTDDHDDGDGSSRDHTATHRHPARSDLDDTLAYYRAMEIALRELLVDKGVLTADEIRKRVEDMDNRSPVQGARVVAKAWADPEYKNLLLSDGGEACVVAGLDRGPYKLVVVENTPAILADSNSLSMVISPTSDFDPTQENYRREAQNCDPSTRWKKRGTAAGGLCLGAGGPLTGRTVSIGRSHFRAPFNILSS
jgi:nitrile hydratase alpha subunit